MGTLILNGRAKILRSEYSAYRKEIIEFFAKKVLPFSTRVLDPMAGTAPLIPFLECANIKAVFNDINPLHYYINRAKCCDVAKLIMSTWDKDCNIVLKELKTILKGLNNNIYVISDKWIPDGILEDLLKAWKKTDSYETNFSFFLKAIILKCIEPYSSFSKTEKNTTWLKPGGMTTAVSIEATFREAVGRYISYYKFFYSDVQKNYTTSIEFRCGDARTIDIDNEFDTIFTSPAYANRYDLTRLFAPSIYFLSRATNCPEIESLKVSQLATNIVKDYLSHNDDLKYIKRVSPKTYRFLMAVRKKGKLKEKEYYLRYFTKYYKNLFGILNSTIQKLSSSGKFYIAVQNNIHRGELNAMDIFIEDFFKSQNYRTTKVFHMMRKHQGKRNISAEHPLVLKKHPESILMVQNDN